ncbi:MAG TPA: ImmA/IrrE family metallo-endopeptidase [Burkholderiales bacterium]|nr:ImmA/IrrE family metallo-endopeptidase [Burkholderiales bacterium]
MAGPSLDGLVSRDLLKWARETSRLDVPAAAKKMNKPEARIRAWEAGEQVPALAQLRQLAKIYKRSIGVFFLEAPPAATEQPADFRRFELSTEHLVSSDLANGIREAEAKRDAALGIYAQLEEEPPAFDLGLAGMLQPEPMAEHLTQKLGITMNDRRAWANDYDALNAWKAAVESLGVLVMQISGVEVSEMRGCSLALFPLPVVILNSTDRPLGRVFTLLHELAHLARAESSLCDVRDEAPRGDREQSIETYCNHVAGAILLPFDHLLQHPAVANARAAEWGADTLATLRRTFWASREAILRRLLMAGKTSQAFYQRMREEYRREHAGDEGDSSAGFASFPRRVVLANGRFLTRLVVDAYDSAVITGSELSRILGTKIDHLPKIVDVLKHREAA